MLCAQLVPFRGQLGLCRWSSGYSGRIRVGLTGRIRIMSLYTNIRESGDTRIRFDVTGWIRFMS